LTNEIKKVQDEWKKIGYASKKDNDKIWKEFRGVCNSFFDERKAFFKSKDDVDKVARDQKKELIEKAKSFKNVSDFSAATKGLIQLQKQWKTVKNAGRYERPLWEEFRKECDAFFNRKDEASKELKQSFIDNLEAKKEALSIFKEQAVDSDTDLSSIKDSMASFISLGPVEREQSGQLMKEFTTSLKDKLTLMKLDKTQIELIIYKFKIDSFALMENRRDYFFKEKNMLKKKLSSLENDVFQSENNMGYFSISKGAEKLFDQVNKKNEQIKEEIALIKRQLKLIPNE
jgi:vacuolar-type H+-ATPase subunit I/STV1